MRKSSGTAHRLRIFRTFAMCRRAAALPFTNFAAFERERELLALREVRFERRGVDRAERRVRVRVADLAPPIACRKTCCAAAVCCPSPA